jgi:hypothetical protein
MLPGYHVQNASQLKKKETGWIHKTVRIPGEEVNWPNIKEHLVSVNFKMNY